MNSAAKIGFWSNELFKVIAENSPRPMLVTNASIEIIYANKAWERQFGYALPEVYGKNPRILQSGKTPSRVFRRMWSALKAGRAFQTDEVIDRRKNGRSFNLFSTVFPVQTRKDTYYVQILDDITKRKKLQAYQSAFIKVAAHDIRSPLAGLQLMSELLARKVQENPDPALKADIGVLHDEIARASRLVSTLLDISLFETGKVTLRPKKIPIRKIIEEVIAHGNRLAPAQQFSIESAEEFYIEGDQERIRQVLINLLENSIKYASSREPIAISVSKENDEVVISVLDRGPGISKKSASRVFQPFYRTDHAKRSKFSGHALGLHIAQKIIHAHHGRIWVAPRKGGGTVFSFTLPLKK